MDFIYNFNKKYERKKKEIKFYLSIKEKEFFNY